MKKIFKPLLGILRFVIFIHLSSSLNGQLITEKVGGVNTDFIIKSDSILLNNSQQLLIKRGAYDFSKAASTAENCSFGYGYGYGYQSYHIEFISKQKICTIIRSKKRKSKRKVYFIISLTDDFGRRYQNIKLKPSEIKSISGIRGHDKIYSYSINLIRVPLILLDNISEFNIIRIEE